MVFMIISSGDDKKISVINWPNNLLHTGTDFLIGFCTLNSAQNPPALLLFNIHVFFKGIFNHENLRVPPPNLPCPAWKKTRAFLIRPTRPLQESMQVVGFFHPFMARPAISERQQKTVVGFPWLSPGCRGAQTCWTPWWANLEATPGRFDFRR